MQSNLARGTGHKLEYGKFQLDIRTFFLNRSMLSTETDDPRDLMKSVFSEVFKTQLDVALSSSRSALSGELN